MAARTITTTSPPSAPARARSLTPAGPPAPPSAASAADHSAPASPIPSPMTSPTRHHVSIRRKAPVLRQEPSLRPGGGARPRSAAGSAAVRRELSFGRNARQEPIGREPARLKVSGRVHEPVSAGGFRDSTATGRGSCSPRTGDGSAELDPPMLNSKDPIELQNDHGIVLEQDQLGRR
jgi:hypothetical protein